jgi:hypothetical protein
MLAMQKNPTADELYSMILARKVTYEEIRRIDPVKFIDLEMTMRMLYDHSSIGGGEPSKVDLLPEVPATNASMRETVRQQSRGRKTSDNSAPVGQKRPRDNKLSLMPSRS